MNDCRCSHWSIAGASARLKGDINILAWLLAEETFNRRLNKTEEIIEPWHGKAHSASTGPTAHP